MKSLIVVLPISVGIAGFITRLTIETLNLTMAPTWVVAAVAAYTAMLFRRSLGALAIIGGITLLANASLSGYTSLQISADVLLSLALTIIVLPVLLHVMGMEWEPFQD